MTPDTATTFLGPWSTFFGTIASAAAALTGLMFVVITLVTGMERRASPDGLSTYSTPTVMHFCAALYVAAVLVAPWHLLIHVAIALGLCGLIGLVYGVRIMIRSARLDAYRPDLEDWGWYGILPQLAYLAILVGALMLPRVPVHALFVVAAGALLMLFIGIRNSWDVVTYLAIKQPDE